MLNTASARVATIVTLMVLHVDELRHQDREEGQALVEYGLILALIAVVCVGVLLAVGGRLDNTLGRVRDALPGTP